MGTISSAKFPIRPVTRIMRGANPAKNHRPERPASVEQANVYPMRERAMANGTSDSVTFDAAAQTALRILIASYFLAAALGLIPGTDLAVLFSAVLPDPTDSALAAGLVFIFSFMIMIGLHTRVAALMLAMMTFYSSYLTMVSLGVEHELGAFWRDLALIAALLLTYSEPKIGSQQRRRLVRRTVTPRRVEAIMARAAAGVGVPRLGRPVSDPPMFSVIARREQRARAKARVMAMTDDDDIDNIFAIGNDQATN